MFKKNKTAALLMSLLICASAAVTPFSAYADNEVGDIFSGMGVGGSAQNGEGDADEPEATADGAESSEELPECDGFNYTVDSNDNVTITGCVLTDSEIVIPRTIEGKTVTDIGASAFGDDSNTVYETIIIPETVEYISESNPFKVCEKLKEIRVDSQNKNFIAEDGVLYDRDMENLLCYPTAKEGKSLKIQEGIKSLGSAAIYGTQLENISFPKSLENISNFAVGHNEKLTSADLSATSVYYIDPYAFSGCKALSEIKLSDKLEYIGGAAFFGCTSLADITFPDTLTTIDQYAFIDTALKQAVIPPTVTEIGYCAFGYRTDESTGGETPIEDFVIVGNYNSAAQIYATDADEDYGYANNFTFRSTEENEDLQEILTMETQTYGDYTVAVENGEAYIVGCESPELTITVPAEFAGIPVTRVYTTAFSNTTANEIILPEGVKELKKLAFYNCIYLKRVLLPQSLEIIGDNAFAGCTDLESADLGGAKEIGANLFDGCTSLEEVTISGNCTAMGAEGEELFVSCTSLESISVTDGDGIFSSEDGVLYNSDKSKLILYPQAKPDKKFKAPKSVKEIGDFAFRNASKLEQAELPSVETIGMYSFDKCTSLKKVKLSKNLSTLGTGAFYNCTALTSLRFTDNLKSIGQCAFGFRYDENADAEKEEPTDVLIDDFKIYAPKGSTAYNYAKDSGIEVLTSTIYFLGLNIDIRLIGVVGGFFVLLLAFLTVGSIKKKSKKKKTEKPEGENNDKQD